MKILLACSAGMSTSLLEKSIKDYATSIGENIDVIAKASNEAREVIKEFDIVLLGPQVRFMENSFKEFAGDIPVVVIPPQIYAMANGQECVKLAKQFLNK